MPRRLLPVLLALAALTADLSGSHGLALWLVLSSIPAAFMVTLDWYGEALEARCNRVRPFFGACGLGLLVLSAALRSPAVVGGVPRLAITAVVLYVLLYAGAMLASARPARPAVRRVVERRQERDRLAA